MESVSNQPLSDHTIGIQPASHVFAIFAIKLRHAGTISYSE